MDDVSSRRSNPAASTPPDSASNSIPPIRHAFVDTAVARFHYAQMGSGTPVLLLPGSGGWKLTFADLIATLAREHTVYALDPPGQGQTRIHDRSAFFGADAVAESIGSFLDAVDVQRTAIVGHSWGGGFALRFAETHTDRVTRLALLAPAGLDVADVWEFRLLRMPAIGEIAVRLMSINAVRHMVSKSHADRNRIPHQRIREYVRMMRQSQDRAARSADLLHVERSVRWADTERDLPTVDIPVLLLWGSEDRYFPVRLIDRFTTRLPRVQPHVITGAGHSLHDDRPDETNAQLTQFLAEDGR